MQASKAGEVLVFALRPNSTRAAARVAAAMMICRAYLTLGEEEASLNASGAKFKVYEQQIQ